MKITEEDIVKYYAEQVLKGEWFYPRLIGWKIHDHLIKTHPELLPVTACEINEETTTLVYDKHGLCIKHGYNVIPFDEILPGCAITVTDEQGNIIEQEDEQ